MTQRTSWRTHGMSQVRRCGVTLGLLALAAVIFHQEWSFFIAPDPTLLLEIRDDIRTVEHLTQWPAEHGQFENEGFVSCRDGQWSASGWCVPPGAVGALRYALPAPPGSRSLLVRLFFFRKDQRATNRLRVFREGDPVPRLTFENVHFADARLDLSPALAGPGGRVVLSFEGENPTPQPDVLLQQIEVRFFADPLPAPPSMLRMSLAMLALGLCWLPLVSWRRLVPLWAVLTVGFILRYVALTRVLFFPLDFDTVGFYQLAKKMQLFTSTGFFSAQFGEREPFFLLIVKATLGLLGDAETHVRLVSLFASLLVMLLTYRVAKRLFGEWFGVFGALLIAISLPMVRESARGMRLEVEIVLLLVFIEIAFLANIRSVWRRAALAGVLGGVLTLTRTNYLVNLSVPILLAFAPRKPRGWLAAGVALLLMVGLYFPYRWNGYRLTGDWCWDKNGRWWANVEFAGTPGWPSKLEMWRSPDGTAPKMSPFEYYFGLHTVPELATGNVRGLWHVMRHMELVAFHRGIERATGINLAFVDTGFQILGMAGLLLAAFTPGLRWLPLTFLFMLVHVTFLYDRGLVESWRHTYHVFPLMVFGVMVSLSAMMRKVRHLLPSLSMTEKVPAAP